MRSRNNLRAFIRAFSEPIERLAQANVALIIVQAVIVRLSIELANGPTSGPNTLILIGILATCIVAGVLVFMLNRIIRRFPHRGLQIAIAVGTLLLQAAAFQLLHTYTS